MLYFQRRSDKSGTMRAPCDGRGIAGIIADSAMDLSGKINFEKAADCGRNLPMRGKRPGQRKNEADVVSGVS